MGNTFYLHGGGNYLRVRGEYGCGIVHSGNWGELPPRARRILSDHDFRSNSQGTTSACAENTAPHTVTHITLWNYLRVRGEY